LFILKMMMMIIESKALKAINQKVRAINNHNLRLDIVHLLIDRLIDLLVNLNFIIQFDCRLIFHLF